MDTNKNISLKPFNSFGVEAYASKLIKIHTVNDILLALTVHSGPYKVLGGGSNIILSGDIKDLILKNEIKGIEVIDEDDKLCMVKVGGGENWHQFVMWSVYHNLGGFENLALIPGTVGAAPIQNIGAYGVEQDQFFHSANVVDLQSGLIKTFYKSDCKFGYRDSIFKSYAKDQYFVTDVTYILRKNHSPSTSYKDITDYFTKYNIEFPTITDVAKAIIEIRSLKLPDPIEIGNAGSFFKNPIISITQFSKLQESHPDIVHYPIDENSVKLPAAWLIDQCGYKGVKKGNTGTYKNQALVIVNHGGASGHEILNFAVEIQAAVAEKFDVDLVPEVNIWG